MQRNTDISVSPAQQTQGTGTGPGGKANTPEAALSEFTLATLQYLESQARHHDAHANMYSALALCHRCDPYLMPADRLILSSTALQRSENSRKDADETRRRAIALRGEANVPDTSPAASSEDATAVIVISVQRDRIRQLATLHMGGAHSAARQWDRVGAGGWKSTDPGWDTREDRIGIELVEFMDAIALPDRVANMLPQRRNPASDAAAKAAEEVRNG